MLSALYTYLLYILPTNIVLNVSIKLESRIDKLQSGDTRLQEDTWQGRAKSPI